jgi:hypothetical protein
MVPDPKRKRRVPPRWQDYATLALGIWIALSPWLLGFFDDVPLATGNALALGALVVTIAALDIDAPARWQAAAGIVLGIWAAISPLALGFAARRGATASMFASGIAIVVLATWTLASAPRDARGAPSDGYR